MDTKEKNFCGKKSFWILVVAVLCLMGLVIVLLTNRVGRQQQTDIPKETIQDDISVEISVSEKPEEGTESMVSSDSIETPESAQTEPAIEQGPWFYQGYTGYLDECEVWTYYKDFIDRDFDGDGVGDRVYREFLGFQNGIDRCNYEIELGNGDRIEIAGVSDVGTPQISSYDITGDGVGEILLELTYDMSVGSHIAYDFFLFEKGDQGYQLADLPFEVSQDGCHTMDYEIQLENQTIVVDIPELQIQDTFHVLDYYLWSRYNQLYESSTQSFYIEGVKVEEDAEGTILHCDGTLFSASWGDTAIPMKIMVAYRAGAYVVTDALLMEGFGWGNPALANSKREAYAAYGAIVENKGNYLLNPYEVEQTQNDRVYIGCYDFDGDQIQELIFGNENGLTVFTYADGEAVKLQELYLPEEWGTIEELYFVDYNGALILRSENESGEAYVCYRYQDGEYLLGTYCEEDYPFSYVNGEKTPYQHIFRETFSISWAQEQCEPIEMLEWKESKNWFYE